MRSDNMYLQNLEDREIDIDIRCLKREELPLQIRPKDSLSVGEKRSFQQMTAPDPHLAPVPNRIHEPPQTSLIEEPEKGPLEGLYDHNFDEVEDYDLN